MIDSLNKSAQVRDEPRIFEELASLCISPGYVHAIAYLCFRDNIIRYADEVTPEDMSGVSSMDNLSRMEIATLIGLLIKAPIDFAMPAAKQLQDYINRSDQLLTELHHVISMESFQTESWQELAETGSSPFQKGKAYREPIFYGGESAYHFQYLDLAVPKYHADNDWMERTKGFSIEAAKAVLRAVGVIQAEKLPARLDEMRHLPPSSWTILPAHIFTAMEVATCADLEVGLVERVLEAFTLPRSEVNAGFTSLSEFNAANARPLIRVSGSEFLLFQSYSLAEALYEAPFYWMSADKAYRATAMGNRGRFTEEFATQRLQQVFGAEHVHTNIDVFESKGRKLGEVDVLVVFANRAIVLQAKSKRLTLEARKGNDQVIKDDFKKSVQDAYDQGRLCASVLNDAHYRFVDSEGSELSFDRGFKEIYILCVVSDHYPALSFQVHQFLKHEESKEIKAPFVLDVFTLDAVTEMLQSPLKFLSYVHRRTMYGERLLSSQELIILSYHLKKNLWFEDDQQMIILSNELSADLDIAMGARRANIPGRKTPEGILTRHVGTPVWTLIEDIEKKADAGTIDLGFELLMLSGETIEEINRAIGTMLASTRRDGKTHDLTVGLGDSGFTLHCTDGPFSLTAEPLKDHCERRKYVHKASSWFGVCLSPSNGRMRFGLGLDYPWRHDPKREQAVSRMRAPAPDIRTAIAQGKKPSRNSPCPCGSGFKFKKCCLG